MVTIEYMVATKYMNKTYDGNQVYKVYECSMEWQLTIYIAYGGYQEHYRHRALFAHTYMCIFVYDWWQLFVKQTREVATMYSLDQQSNLL